MIVEWGLAHGACKAKDEGRLIVLMDRFAVAVLKQAEVAKDLPDKIAAGVLMAQWIWVKHCLGYDEDQELTSLSELRAAVMSSDGRGAAGRSFHGHSVWR
jgi:hypothetical protein